VHVICCALLAVLATGQDCQEVQDLARRAYEERRYDQAALHFEGALAACGPSSTLFLALGQARLLAQRPADALASLERIPAEDPGYVSALKVKAKALYFLARDAEAEAALKTAAARAPGDPEVPYDLGRIYYQQGRHARAAEAFRRATALDAQSYRAWDNLGLAVEALGDVAQAQQYYLKAIALVHKDHPRYDVVYANFAELLIKLGNYQRAFDLAAEAAQRNPDDPRNLFLAGKSLVQLGRSDLGVRWFEQAIKLDPDYPEPHYLLAQAYRKMGRTEDADRALKAFQAATARAPKVRR
jgi:tetratricopeptide (TPR) repeat protein